MTQYGGGNVWLDPDSRGAAIQSHAIVNPVRANPQAAMEQAAKATNQWRDPDEIGSARSVAELPHKFEPKPVGQTPTITMDEEVDVLKKTIKALGLEGTDQSRQIMRQIAQAEYTREGGARDAVRGSLARWGIGSPKGN